MDRRHTRCRRAVLPWLCGTFRAASPTSKPRLRRQRQKKSSHLSRRFVPALKHTKAPSLPLFVGWNQESYLPVVSLQTSRTVELLRSGHLNPRPDPRWLRRPFVAWIRILGPSSHKLAQKTLFSGLGDGRAVASAIGPARRGSAKLGTAGRS